MKTKVAYLGPEGTYAEKAAHTLAKLEKLENPTFIPCVSLRSVIEHLAKKLCDAAVVPIENSVEGGVTTSSCFSAGEPRAIDGNRDRQPLVSYHIGVRNLSC